MSDETNIVTWLVGAVVGGQAGAGALRVLKNRRLRQRLGSWIAGVGLEDVAADVRHGRLQLGEARDEAMVRLATEQREATQRVLDGLATQGAATARILDQLEDQRARDVLHEARIVELADAVTDLRAGLDALGEAQTEDRRMIEARLQRLEGLVAQLAPLLTTHATHRGPPPPRTKP